MDTKQAQQALYESSKVETERIITLMVSGGHKIAYTMIFKWILRAQRAEESCEAMETTAAMAERLKDRFQAMHLDELEDMIQDPRLAPYHAGLREALGLARQAKYRVAGAGT